MSTFQEYDCPDCGIDFDLDDERIVMAGERFACSGCSKGWHTAEEVGLTCTAIPTPGPGADGEDRFFEFRGLPSTPEEKAAWIDEGRRNQAARDAAGSK